MGKRKKLEYDDYDHESKSQSDVDDPYAKNQTDKLEGRRFK